MGGVSERDPAVSGMGLLSSRGADARAPTVPSAQLHADPRSQVSPGDMRKRRIYMLGCGLGLLAYFALALTDSGPAALRDVLNTALQLAALAVCLSRAAADRARRTGWLLISVGVGAWASGDLLFVLVHEPAGTPSPTLSDAFYLTFYLACFAALAVFARERTIGFGFSLNAVIGVLTIAMVWAAVVPAEVFDTSGSVASAATHLLYPSCDILLLALVAVLLTKAHWRLGTATWLFATALSVMAVADTVYLVQVARGTYETGTLVDGLWPTALVLVGLAALTPSAPVRLDRAAGEYLFPLACAFIALGVLVWNDSHPTDTLTVGLAAAVIATSIVRGTKLYLSREGAARRAQETLRHTVTALALAVDAKDAYTANHSQRVTLYALAIGVDLDLDPDMLGRLTTAGELHDVGKLAIPDSVLLKPGRLTQTEFEIMKTHSVAGERIVAEAGMQTIAAIVRQHHERFDGRGYPDGIAGQAISLEARVLAVADSLDAMTSDRSYSRSMDAEQAQAELVRNSGSQFDPEAAASAVALIDRGVICPGQQPAVDIRALVGGRTHEDWVPTAERLSVALAQSDAARLAPEQLTLAN